MGSGDSSSAHVSKSAYGKGGSVNTRFLMDPAFCKDNRKPQQMYQTFSHYRETRLTTFEQACSKIPVRNLHMYVSNAKNYSRYPKKGLKQDEQAAINLYTQQTPFYKLLNDALRKNDKSALMPWYAYLKLFTTALKKLDPYQGTVWRGVAKDLSSEYPKETEHIWWSFSSCTSSIDILESPSFLGNTGARTLFNIEVCDGRLISEFSEFAEEDEILLLPGTRVRVVSVLKQSGGLTIIHLKQLPSSSNLFGSEESSLEGFQSNSHFDPYSSAHDHQPQHYQQQQDQPQHYQYESLNADKSHELAAFDTQIQLAKNISNDSEKARTLKHLLSNKNLTDKMIADVAECVESMYADREKSDVLQLIAQRSGLTSQQFRVSVEAADTISNDNCRATVIRAFLVHEQFTVQTLDIVLSLTKSMYSASQKSSVFSDLIKNRYLNANHYPGILEGIETISNDSYKNKVLCEIARKLPKNDGRVCRAYLSAADSISSSKDKAEATMAFTADFNSNNMHGHDAYVSFDTQIQLAKNISNDSEKARTLKHLLSNKNLTDNMIAGVAECVESMHAAKEKSDVLQLIAKRSGLTSQQFRVSVKAAGTIGNDNCRATVIGAFLVHEQFTVQNLDVILSSTESMYSASDKSSVFYHLIKNRYLNANHYPRILKGIQTIGNDSYKSKVLCEIAPKLPKNDASVRSAYLFAADSIYSDKEKATVTMAFM